jgi:hypothetical protein
MPPASGPSTAITESKYARSALTVARHAAGGADVTTPAGTAGAPAGVSADVSVGTGAGAVAAAGGGAASESWPHASQNRPASAAPQAWHVAPSDGRSGWADGAATVAAPELAAAGAGPPISRPQTSQNSSSADW